MALIEGHSKPRSDHPSILFFTQHKCASVLTNYVMRLLALDSRLIPINYDFFVFQGQADEAAKNWIYSSGGKSAFPESGYSFAPIRTWHAGIPPIDNYRVVLMLRDPRDVLVSFYFSMAKSHALPLIEAMSRDTIMRERASAEASTIDDYVIERAPELLDRYRNYINHVMGRPNVLFLRYEEMVSDFSGWLNRVIAHCELRPQPATLTHLLSSTNFTVDREDPTKHVRQVTPGDHKRKLRPETIVRLNEIFAEVLQPLGYES
jgi:hypothetical protein